MEDRYIQIGLEDTIIDMRASLEAMKASLENEETIMNTAEMERSLQGVTENFNILNLLNNVKIGRSTEAKFFLAFKRVLRASLSTRMAVAKAGSIPAEFIANTCDHMN